MTPARASLVSATTLASAMVALGGAAQANIIYSVNGVTNAPVTIDAGETGSYTLVGITSTANMNIRRIAENKGGPPNASTTNVTFSGPITTSSTPIRLNSTAPTTLTQTNSNRNRTFLFTPTERGAASSTVTVAGVNPNNVPGVGYVANSPDTTLVTVNGTGVAPVASVSTVAAGPVRVGTTGTATATVENVGDGNLAGSGSDYNLRGLVSAIAGLFTGGGGALNGGTGLNDQNAGPGATTKADFAFTYAPTARGADSEALTVKLDNGANATTNASGTATVTLAGTAVGPVYAAALDSKANTIASGTEITFGDMGGGVTLHNLLISNISDDNASDLSTRLTVTAEIIGDAASEFSFSLSDFFTGDIGTSTGPATATLRNVVNGSDLGKVSVQFVSKTNAVGTAQLRITTDEGRALGVMGPQVYVYNLIGGPIPEPGTLMVFGSGLLGLVMAVRRRRSGAPTSDAPLLTA
jgi:hypothetical protein